MTLFVFDNNINTTLASSVGSGATTITLSSATNLPASIPSGAFLVVTLNDAATRQVFEIMYATAVTGSTLTVLRGQEGTTALSWSAGDFVFSGVTAGQMGNFDQNIHGIQVYNTAGTFTFTVPAGVTLLEVDGWGGGGGGSGNAGGQIGGSGGSGAYGRKRCSVTPGQTITVTIPAAAVGGVGGASGLPGGTCSFGSFMSVAGGNGGQFNSGNNTAGGTAPTGVDLAIAGGLAAASAFAGTTPVGQGGNAPRGGGGGPATNGTGVAGNWPGGGGGAGANTAVGTIGGAGAVGGFVIQW